MSAHTGAKHRAHVVTAKAGLAGFTRALAHDLVVVDMANVDFLDSTGLGVLVEGLKRARARSSDLAIVATQDKILKIFDITGLNKAFAIHRTVDDAVGEPTPEG